MKFICRESLTGLDRASRYKILQNYFFSHSVIHEERYCHIQMANSNDKIGAYAFCD